MKKVLDYILFGLILTGLVFIAWKTYTLKEKVEYITTTDTITVCDTITQLKPQYITISHFDTVPMEVLVSDTIIDTLLVQIPIERYHYDSIIVDSNYTTHFSASLTGYKLSFDTLCLSTEIIENKPVPAPKKWYDNFGIGVGVMYGTGGFGVGAGLMYKL